MRTNHLVSNPRRDARPGDPHLMMGQPVQLLYLRGGRVDHRHRHDCGYLQIVLEGEHTEAGDEGRRRVGPGDVLIHRAFDAHCNIVGAKGAKVLTLPLVTADDLPPMGHIDDPDEIVRVAENDAHSAAAFAVTKVVPRPPDIADWPDRLAEDLRRSNVDSLKDWARAFALAPETVSRGFRKCYGVGPARYRREYQARTAMRRIMTTTDSLSQIAVACGFCDQSHMGRAVRAISGNSPLHWRLG